MRISDVIDGRYQEQNQKKKRSKFITVALLTTGILSMIFIAVTIYGQFTGTYVMNLSDEASELGIELSKTPDFNDAADHLDFEPLSNGKEFDFRTISAEQLSIIRNHYGQYFGGGRYYTAYTFFLRNSGKQTVEINYNLVFTNVINNLHEVARIHMIHTTPEDTILESPKTFKIKDGVDSSKRESYDIADDSIGLVAPGEIHKFTIILWLHGPNVAHRHVGGAVQIGMTFSIKGEE